MSVKKRLEELNIQLTAPATPLANYIPVKQAGNLVYVSGQLPSKSGELLYAGKLGKDITLEQGKQAARQCAINAVAALNSQIDLDDIKSIVKVQVFVNCTEDFIQSPEVANGASELLVEVFGEAGRHTRAAVGVYQLPKGAAVEVDLIAEI